MGFLRRLRHDQATQPAVSGEVIADPGYAGQDVRRVGDPPYDRTDCPYCGAVQDPLPKAKRKCPSCGQPVYVRTGPDGQRHLLREADLDAHQATWDAHHAAKAALRAIELNREAARLSREALASYVKFGANGVQVFGGDDDEACPACRAVSGKVYPLDQAPPIPIPGCTNDICRCDYLPVI